MAGCTSRTFIDSAIFTITVNKPVFVKFGGPLERDAVRILRDIPEVTVQPTTPKGRAATVLQAGDVTCVVEVKAQRVANAATARQLAEYAKELPGDTHLIVVARTTTGDARQLLEEAGVGLFDTAGNMRVRLPGLFIWTEGRREAPRHPGGPDEPPVKLTGKAGIAAEALLMEPERDWKVRDLAERASVSTALAHRLLVRLERERLVEAKGAGPHRTRRVTNRTALLDLWAEEMRDRSVTEARAFRLARDPRGQAKTLSRFLVEANIDHAVTGAAGAALLAPFITAIPVVDVWVTETASLDEVMGDVGADRVHDGHNIVVRQLPGDAPLAFRQRVQEVWVANPFRLFYDLRQDPRRGREQADRLREEVIGF
ncbi:MAG: helix-turn-helix domain-containing protein [Actinomycetota bacterium]